MKKEPLTEIATGELPEPQLPEISGTHNIVITGVGGTGVVTIGAVLAMAAHLDGKGAGVMEMAGLAQKGGAVHIHCRLAGQPEDISAIRVATGECNALIGGDLVVSAGASTLGLLAAGASGGVVNSHDTVTGEFTRDTEFRIPSDKLELSLQARLQDNLTLFDATELARVLMGDTIYSNMMVFGAAWQAGLIPLGQDAIRTAIELNGTAVERNLKAFDYGRWAALNQEDAARVLSSDVVSLPKTLAEKVAYRADHLQKYQSSRLAKKYQNFVDGFAGEDMQAAVAEGYHKLLSYKDEYEVARLLLQTEEQARATFDGDLKLTYHLAPPVPGGKNRNGRPEKRGFGALTLRLMPLLARMKMLRGTAFDPFGRSAERRMERALIRQYEHDLSALPTDLLPHQRLAALSLARLPLDIRGFGPVKMENEAKAAKRREALLAEIAAPASVAAA